MTLLARYKLDGNARDSEGSAHGTAIDVTWAPSHLVDGGGEARLNGTTSRIETAIQFTTETAASLPVWFRPREGAGHLIGQHDGTNGLAIEQTETGKIRLVVNGTASAEVAVYPGEYHHAVPVYDNGEATLYLDNEAVASVTATVTWPAVPVTIGAREDGSAPIECDVVDVRGYNEALDNNQVAALTFNINAQDFSDDGRAVAPIAHFVADAADGGSIPDETGNYVGTVVGATKVTDSEVGWALDFDGSGDRIETGFRYADETEFTVAMKVYPRTGQGYFFSQWVSSPSFRGPFMQNTSNDSLQLYINNNTSLPEDEGKDTEYGHNKWLIIVAAYKDARVQLYTNKTLYFDRDCESVIWPAIDMFIGDRSDYQRGINAKIKEVAFFDKRLSKAEVEHLVDRDFYRTQTRIFPHSKVGSVSRRDNVLGWNPAAIPRIPNPTAIPRSGRSTVQGVTALLAPPAWFDQRDGSGGSHLSPAGVVSRPDRQGRLSGNTTDQNGQPVSRRVRCFERRTGRIVRETWSNAAGYYQFDDLDPGKRFTVVAHDYSGTYNAVIADNAQPEVPA